MIPPEHWPLVFSRKRFRGLTTLFWWNARDMIPPEHRWNARDARDIKILLEDWPLVFVSKRCRGLTILFWWNAYFWDSGGSYVCTPRRRSPGRGSTIGKLRFSCDAFWEKSFVRRSRLYC